MRGEVAVLLDSGIWAAWGTAAGLTVSKLPRRCFENDSFLTRVRNWEHDGRTWARLGVRRWKERLPEAGGLFGGVPKRHLPKGPDGLERFVVETRRGEVAHWAAALPILVMPMWGPLWVSGVMVFYGFAANAPCVVVQRYNRARLMPLIEERQRRRTVRGPRTAPPAAERPERQVQSAGESPSIGPALATDDQP